MKWLLLSDYTHYLRAKESSFFKYISGTPTVVWIVFKGKRARLVCSTSHMESMKAFYNGEKNERSKIRVRWKKEERKAGWQKSLNLLFLTSALLCISKLSWKNQCRKRKSLLNATSMPRLILIYYEWESKGQSHDESGVQNKKKIHEALAGTCKTKWCTRAEWKATVKPHKSPASFQEAAVFTSLPSRNFPTAIDTKGMGLN